MEANTTRATLRKPLRPLHSHRHPTGRSFTCGHSKWLGAPRRFVEHEPGCRVCLHSDWVGGQMDGWVDPHLNLSMTPSPPPPMCFGHFCRILLCGVILRGTLGCRGSSVVVGQAQEIKQKKQPESASSWVHLTIMQTPWEKRLSNIFGRCCTGRTSSWARTYDGTA